MEFIIAPLNGAGPLEFGMSSAQVRGFLGSNWVQFKRTPQSTPCDHFQDQGVFCYYDDSNALEAIEFASPARPTLRGLELLGLSLDVAKQFVVAGNQAHELESDSLSVKDLGLALYSPLAKEDPGARIESVMVFRAGYYD